MPLLSDMNPTAIMKIPLAKVEVKRGACLFSRSLRLFSHTDCASRRFYKWGMSKIMPEAGHKNFVVPPEGYSA